MIPLSIAALLTLALPAADRNVVLIIADDLGLQCGCYGDAIAKTPNIDALAREGVRFTDAFCTTSSCSPSRSVMFTGLQNHANGQLGLAHAEHNFHQRPGTPNLFRILRSAGWRTAIIGKKHVLPEDAYKVDFEPKVNPRNPIGMGRQAREFFMQHGKFFAVIGFTDPHRARSDFANDGKGAPKPPFLFEPTSMKVPPYLPDVAAVRADWADYLAAVSRLDQGVGEVMKALKDSGKENDTLVIFLSDNGPPFPGAKCGLYEPGVHLPLIVRKPDCKPNAICNAMTTWCDLAPSILDWVGVNPNLRFHGRSWLSAMDSPSPSGWNEVYFSHTFHEITMFYPMRAVRYGSHKLIWNLAHELPFPNAQDLAASPTWQYIREHKPALLGTRTFDAFSHRPEFELYDLQADPDEIHNLASDVNAARPLHELQARLRNYLKETNDPFKNGISRTLD